MSFKSKKYTIVRQAISKDLAGFFANYFKIKKQVYITMLRQRYLSPFERMMGTFEDMQCYNTYSVYADIAMETLLLKIQPVMEKTTGLKLTPNYSYARMYKKGDLLHRHKDRFGAEISATMNLGGDHWPIFLDPTGQSSVKPSAEDFVEESKRLIKNPNKGLKVNLKPGDMLVYSGCEIEHWREKFKGKECIQVFLHYNNRKTPGAKENMFDTRPHLGLPPWFKKNK